MCCTVYVESGLVAGVTHVEVTRGSLVATGFEVGDGGSWKIDSRGLSGPANGIGWVGL